MFCNFDGIYFIPSKGSVQYDLFVFWTKDTSLDEGFVQYVPTLRCSELN